MPLNLPAVDQLLTRANFGSPVKSFVDALEASITTLQSTVSSLQTSLTAGLSTKVTNAQGHTASWVGTQSQYDALATKSGTTTYDII